MIDHLQITLPIKPFSPVSDVPSSGAGETPNDTPAHNPLSNGVPVSDCIAQSVDFDYEQCDRCGYQIMDFGGCGCREWGV